MARVFDNSDPSDPKVRLKRCLQWMNRALLVVLSALVAYFVWMQIVFFVLPHVDNPRAEAMTYLEALADGDADRAMLLSRAGLSSEEDFSLLTNEVFDGAVERMSDHRIEGVRRATFLNGDCRDARVEVSFSLDGKRSTRTLNFAKINNEWTLCWGLEAPFIITFNCRSEGDPIPLVTVSGVEIPWQRRSEFLLYPAVYRVEVTSEEATLFDDRYGRNPAVDVVLNGNMEAVHFCLREDE
ncbi:MAG: hypothetical protein FWD18_04995 [Micrococcales bacterium]|nr:hypothetical protein [Micrococcales bacterium]